MSRYGLISQNNYAFQYCDAPNCWTKAVTEMRGAALCDFHRKQWGTKQ